MPAPRPYEIKATALRAVRKIREALALGHPRLAGRIMVDELPRELMHDRPWRDRLIRAIEHSFGSAAARELLAGARSRFRQRIAGALPN